MRTTHKYRAIKVNAIKPMFVTLAFVFVLFLLPYLSPKQSLAQESSQWTYPKLLYTSDYEINEGAILSDIYDNVHIFWIEGSSNNAIIPAIFHESLNGDIFSAPNSILLSPDNGVLHAPEVVGDNYGLLHIIFNGGNNRLYYSSVNAAEANNARSWKEPKIIANALLHAGITTTSDGVIYVVYPGVGKTGVFFIVSTDHGETWSAPINISLPDKSNTAADFTQISVDTKGIIHVVWTEYFYPEGWPPSGIFYSASLDGGLNWIRPVKIEGEGYDQITIKSDINDIVHIVWNGSVDIGGRYHSLSKTTVDFTSPYPVIPAGIGGTSGYPQIDFDSKNNIHFISSIEEFGGIVYSQKMGNYWSGYTNISKSVDMGDYQNNLAKFPGMIIRNGNEINVIYQIKSKKIYFQQYKIDAPEIHNQINKIASHDNIKIDGTSTQSPNKQPTTAPTISNFSTDDFGQSETNPAVPILLGLIPVFIILGMLFIWQGYKRKR